MFLGPRGWVLAAVTVLHTAVAGAAGLDEVYEKPAAAKSWGELLAQFLGVRDGGKSYALIVGVSDYRNGFPPLVATRDDPLRMRDFLLHEAGFDHVHVLTDDKATKARIEQLMVDEFPKLVGSNDRFLFYWSGHGTQDEDAFGGMMGFLPLADSPKDSFSSMLSMEDVRRWDRRIRAKQALFLLDACFSGLAGVEVKEGELTDLTIEQLSQPAHHLMTAGTGEEQTIAGDRWGGSIFTDSVLRGLQGEADAQTGFPRDGVVSLAELIAYVRQRVAFEKGQAGWRKAITPQLRHLRDNRGEFFFLTNAKKIAALEEAGRRPTGEFKHGLPVVMMSDAADAGQPTAPVLPVDPETERLFWDTIKHETDPAYFKEYLRLVEEQHFPGIFVGLARLKLKALEREPAPGHSAETALNAKGSMGPTPEPSPTPTPVGPETIEAALRLTGTQWREVQRALATLGHDPGPSDGKPGPRTRAALRAWQQARGDEATGYLTSEQHEALVAAASGADMAVGVFGDGDAVMARSGAPEPGPVFKDCRECPEMVVVPGGTFLMGSPRGEAGRDNDEGPQHDVTVAPFAIGKYEVTFAEWDACVQAGGCSHRPDDRGWGRARRPVINVSWRDAREYVAWLSRKTGGTYRLPSEAEWEYAARAGTTTPFWWGERATPAMANYDDDPGRTTGVGTYRANPWGLHDVAGNVWEWVEDCWNDSYDGAPMDGSPWLEGDCSLRVVRGGSWFDRPESLRSASRFRAVPDVRFLTLGFRASRALTP